MLRGHGDDLEDAYGRPGGSAEIRTVVVSSALRQAFAR